MDLDFKKHKIYLDERAKCYPAIGDIMAFYKELIDLWAEAIPDDISSLLSVERLSGGLPMLDEGKIKEADFTNSVDLAQRIFRLIQDYKMDKSTTIVGFSREDIVEFIKSGLSREDRFKNAILKWILKPSFDFAQTRAGDLRGGWNAGRCPLCYSPPGMAIVEGGEEQNAGHRLLSCCFCGYRWSFDPDRCPSCGNNRPEMFGFFVGESGCEQGSRAISCEECKTYIKTVFVRCREDGRGPMDLDMDVEDVATIPLDIIANQRGYKALCQS